ncbi:putative RNA methyltransferase [Desertihabitans aurantiacus]|uniref:putative RNA methyltransferase n=1 Tax=Desertihabitans aurantiacus TaxID=2282477 RepID=UPI000DF7BD50|nr:methyltransferase domain-containing protein [Desertihabitans aurantiacus]
MDGAEHLADVFVCPLCTGAFGVRDGRTLACPAGHAFDVAREGYVNLVPAQSRRSKQPGYNSELMTARHRFFGSGGYRPVAEAVAGLAAAGADAGARVLDAGCGEGYYLRVLRERAPGLDLLGTDVSRPGVRTASRADPAGAYAVASSYALPVPDASLDVLVSHFSPNPVEEFARVLRPGGTLLVGGPGADHLFSLKAAVYDHPRRHDEDKHVLTDHRFTRVGREVVRYELPVGDPGTLAALFTMTPYTYGATDADRLPGRAGGAFSTEVHVLLDRYVRTS